MGEIIELFLYFFRDFIFLIIEIFFDITLFFWPSDKKEDLLDKRYLSREVTIKFDLDESIKKGSKGYIWEVLDKSTFLIEFPDENNEPIAVGEKRRFTIQRKSLTLHRIKRKLISRAER